MQKMSGNWGFGTILFDRQSHRSATHPGKFNHTRLGASTNVHSPDSFLPVDTVEVVSKRSIR
jgi:hypothetical protein